MGGNNQPQKQQQPQQSQIPTKQNKPLQPTQDKQKKDDAWSMASGLVDLDKNFGSQSTKYASFDPKTMKQPQQSANLPNLSSYGQNKPDLTGFGGVGDEPNGNATNE